MVVLKPTTPEDLASTLDATAARDAAPPMWKVRIVSCVPGSPIDCGATPPPASPTLTHPGRPRARNPAPQRFFSVPAPKDGAHQRAVGGAAIVFGRDQVLRHVDQAAR